MANKFWGYPLIFAFRRLPLVLGWQAFDGQGEKQWLSLCDVPNSDGRCAFDKHYSEKHVPLVKAIPGVRKYEISRGPVATPAGPSVYHLVAIVHFDDLVAIQKWKRGGTSSSG